MTDEAGAKLLAHVEALMVEVQGLRGELRDAVERLPRVSDDAMRVRKMRVGNSVRNMRQGGDRNTTGRAVSVTTRNSKPSDGRNRVRNAPQVVKALELDQGSKKDPSAVTPAVTAEKAGEHPELVAYFVDSVKRVTGVGYDFGAEDGKHVKDMLRRFGLPEAKRIVDLAIARYQADEFHRGRGLTLRLVASDANALRTAQTNGARPDAAKSGRAVIHVAAEQEYGAPGRKML